MNDLAHCVICFLHIKCHLHLPCPTVTEQSFAIIFIYLIILCSLPLVEVCSCFCVSIYAVEHLASRWVMWPDLWELCWH